LLHRVCLLHLTLRWPPFCYACFPDPQPIYPHPTVQDKAAADEAESPSSRIKASHSATVVAARPSVLLAISATDLRRFGRRLQESLAGYASQRKDFLQQRAETVQVGVVQGGGGLEAAQEAPPCKL
jgi:hypothetical protein